MTETTTTPKRRGRQPKAVPAVTETPAPDPEPVVAPAPEPAVADPEPTPEAWVDTPAEVSFVDLKEWTEVRVNPAQWADDGISSIPAQMRVQP